MMRFVTGTKEYMVIDITETLGEILDLTETIITFDIYDSLHATKIVDSSPNVIVSGLQVKCLIEPLEEWGVGEFTLYAKILGLPSDEEPRLGPVPFIVED